MNKVEKEITEKVLRGYNNMSIVEKIKEYFTIDKQIADVDNNLEHIKVILEALEDYEKAKGLGIDISEHKDLMEVACDNFIDEHKRYYHLQRGPAPHYISMANGGVFFGGLFIAFLVYMGGILNSIVAGLLIFSTLHYIHRRYLDIKYKKNYKEIYQLYDDVAGIVYNFKYNN